MNAKVYRHLFLFSITILLTLALVTPAFADKPEFITIAVDDTFPAAECDGFTVLEHVEGTIKVSTHFDKNGNVVMDIARFRLRHTLSNSETGASLFSPDAGIDKVTIKPDGSGTAATIGVIARIVVPGEGLVFANIGRIVFDLNTGEVLSVAGPHDDFANLPAILCSALD